MEIPPLAILAVGIVTVIGLIIVLRLHAFLALIVAAMVVSLLAPGETEEKIARVAAAFGDSAAKIAVVIALAAVIGKCMMDSGAADRVVRAFLRLFGEKRAGGAMMGSGFVLAVPVFFDTVFYLLVPLARSLYTKTRQHYLKYILAIAAGGAITHTLVPPTPGPLVMASQLNIDLGVMILMGAVVAIPAAIVGLLFSAALDRKMPIPMRSLGNEPEPTLLDDSQLPSLFMSLLPVLLPVLLISANTVLKTLADAEGAAQLSAEDVNRGGEFVSQLGSQLPDVDLQGDLGPNEIEEIRRQLRIPPVAAFDDPQPHGAEPAKAVVDSLLRAAKSKPAALKFLLKVQASGGDATAPVPNEDAKSAVSAAALAEALNAFVLVDRDFFDPAESDFDEAVVNDARLDRKIAEEEAAIAKLERDKPKMPAQLQQGFTEQQDRHRETIKRLKRGKRLNAMLANRGGLSKEEIQRMNRLLLETAFPEHFALHAWETPLRKAQHWSSLFGNPNFALLLSAVLAMWTLYCRRKPTLVELGKVIEVALMSGGVIILITAAGGAFGEMLKAAQIGDAVQSQFGGGAHGRMLLFLGFGVAALLKVAQGSSTVAMITGSSMLAAMITAPEDLPFNVVYLATAIGAGSLIGSWMNDSGFWIFAKMGGLTEVEALKSWTILLIVLGTVSMAVTILLATLLPLKGL